MWMLQVQSLLFFLRYQHFDHILQVGDPSKQHFYIHLFVHFLPSFINLLAILPIRLTATKSAEPIVDSILDIGEEVEIFFLCLSRYVRIRFFTDHKFIPVKVVRVEKEGKEDNDNLE